MVQNQAADGDNKFRVLILEDEPLIAFGIEDVLLDAGFAIAGVETKLEGALTLIESGDCDAAVVDVNLAGVCADPAAVALAQHGLPFIVLSGYLQEQLKAGFAGGRYLQKPCRPELLIETLTNELHKQLNLEPLLKHRCSYSKRPNGAVKGAIEHQEQTGGCPKRLRLL